MNKLAELIWEHEKRLNRTLNNPAERALIDLANELEAENARLREYLNRKDGKEMDDWPEDWWKIAAETLEIPLEEPASITATPPRERWLNGWHRRGGSVLIGTAYHCAGCGAFLGLGCVAIDDTPWPEKQPDFPFEEATCPLCQLRRMPDPPDRVDKLTERLERLKKRDSVAVEEERGSCAKILEIEAAKYDAGLPGPTERKVAELLLALAIKIRARSADKGRE